MATIENISRVEPIRLKQEEAYSHSPLRLTLKRFLRHKMAVVGALVMLGILLYVVVGSLVYSEADANFNNPSIRLQAPSQEYLFGTDRVGRNVMIRTIYGGQISLIIGVFAMLVGVIIGTVVGAISGYYGGVLDAILGRITEAMLSIPNLLILLVAAKFLGGRMQDIHALGRTFSGSVMVIIVIVGFTSWMELSRVVRANVLSLKEREFVIAARSIGASNSRIIIRHIIPNTLAPIIVAATLGIGGAIITEAYISYFGLGVQLPSASWGNILDDARSHVKQAPWLWLSPSVLIILTVLSINFVGDGLRDALDPQSDKTV